MKAAIPRVFEAFQTDRGCLSREARERRGRAERVAWNLAVFFCCETKHFSTGKLLNLFLSGGQRTAECLLKLFMFGQRPAECMIISFATSSWTCRGFPDHPASIECTEGLILRFPPGPTAKTEPSRFLPRTPFGCTKDLIAV